MIGGGVITLLVALRVGKWLLFSGESNHAAQVREAQRSGDHRRAGDLQAKRGNFEMAARLYERGGEFARQGHALRKVGDLRGAAEAFAKGGEHGAAADLYCQTEQYGKAAEQYLHAGDRASMRRAAQAFQKTGQFARAGRLMHKLGEFESAARLYSRAETLEPPDLVVSMLENAALALPGDSPKRAELLHQAASAAYKLGLYERAASAFDGAGKPLEAARLYERALSRFDLAAALYVEAGRGAEADRLEERAGGALAVLRARQDRARERGDSGLADELGETIERLQAQSQPSQFPPPVDPTALKRRSARQSARASAAQTAEPTASAVLRSTNLVREAGARYDIEGELGRGGMGVVYRARDRLLGRQVALKFLPEDLSADSKQGKLLRREARAAAQLSHPGIVTIYDIGRRGDREFIAMELVHGDSLETLLDERGKFSVLAGLEVMQPVLEAVAYAHGQRVVHRDLKPANIMRLSNGAIKVMDFGLAKLTGTTGGKRTSFIAGTPAYMPPEQLTGITDERSDVFALGATFYELLTGELPGNESICAYGATGYDTPRDRFSQIPERLSDFIMGMLEHDPRDRPSIKNVLDLVTGERARIIETLKMLE